MSYMKTYYAVITHCGCDYDADYIEVRPIQAETLESAAAILKDEDGYTLRQTGFAIFDAPPVHRERGYAAGDTKGL